jgi:hypothetical protein
LEAVSDPTTESVVNVVYEAANEQELRKQEYRKSAEGLSDIVEQIIIANKNTIDLFHSFRYLDFDNPNFNQIFGIRMTEYHKTPPYERHKQLKWSCSRIKEIYDNNIRPKIGDILKEQAKVRKANDIFDDLYRGDEKMVSFVRDQILARLDTFISELEQQVNSNQIHLAKRSKLKFRIDTQETYNELQKIRVDLNNLAAKLDSIVATGELPNE